MIIVPFELHSAITGQEINLGTIVIVNDGSGTENRRHYDVYAVRKGVEPKRAVLLYRKTGKGGVFRTGRVENHPAKQEPVLGS